MISLKEVFKNYTTLGNSNPSEIRTSVFNTLHALKLEPTVLISGRFYFLFVFTLKNCLYIFYLASTQ